MSENTISMKVESNKNIRNVSESITSKKYKDILNKISKGSLVIREDILLKEFSGKKTGWVKFSVNLKDIGLSNSDFNEDLYLKEIFSNYIMDFVGELLIRTNIERFMELVFSINHDEYLSLVSCERHKRFGAILDFQNKKLIMEFHVSLIQTILTEEFK